MSKVKIFTIVGTDMFNLMTSYKREVKIWTDKTKVKISSVDSLMKPVLTREQNLVAIYTFVYEEIPPKEGPRRGKQ